MPRRNSVQDEESDRETVAFTGNHSAPEDTGDEKVRKSTGTTKVGASKKKTKVKHERRATAGQEIFEDATNNANTEPENDALISFNKDEFLATARPISRGQVEIINSVMYDLQHLATQVEHVGFELVAETAMAIGEVSGDTKDGEEVRIPFRSAN